MVNVGQVRQTSSGSEELVKLLRRADMEIAITRYASRDITPAFLEILTDFNQLVFPPCSRYECMRDFSERSDTVYVAINNATGEILGIAGEIFREREGEPTTYMPVGGTAESGRGKGIYPELTYLRITNSLSKGLTTISVNTQNANVEYGIRKTLDRMIEECLIESYTLERVAEKGAYERFGCRPAGDASLKCPSEEINQAYAALGTLDSFELVMRLKLREG